MSNSVLRKRLVDFKFTVGNGPRGPAYWVLSFWVWFMSLCNGLPGVSLILGGVDVIPTRSLLLCSDCQILVDRFCVLISFRDIGFIVLWYYFMIWISCVLVMITWLTILQVLFNNYGYYINDALMIHSVNKKNEIYFIAMWDDVFNHDYFIFTMMHCYNWAFDVWLMIYYDTYPILASVWCACLFYLLSDVFDVVKGGSRSHLWVRIYTMHHSLPLPV